MPPKKGKKAAAKKSPAKAVKEPEPELEQSEEDALLDTSQENGNSMETTEDQEMEVKLDEEEVNGAAKRNIDEVDDDEDDDGSKKMKTDDEEEDDPNKPITLFCGNLDPDLSTETLERFFTMNEVEVSEARKIKWKRFGYVNVTKDMLDAALALSGKELNGIAIKVDISVPKEKEPVKNEADDRTMFVKNLHEGTNEETLRLFFKDIGNIKSVRLPKKPNGKCKGFGYIVFEKEEMVEKAIEAKQGEELNSEKLFLDYTNEKSQYYQETHGTKEYGPSKVLFVRNLSFQVTEEELKEIFDGCVACRIPPNPYGNPKGYGFVEYNSVEEAQQAQKDKDGLEINGRVVQLAFADDKESGNAPRRRPMRRGGMWGPRGRGGMWGGPWGGMYGGRGRGGWGPGGWGWGGGPRGRMPMGMGWGWGGGPAFRGRGRGGRRK